MTHQAERRSALRTPLAVLVEFTSRDSPEKVPGVSRNISLRGMFIETAFPAAFGVGVLVGFTLPGHGKPLLVSGTVRWTSKSGMGVQFGPLGVRETHAITALARERGSSPPGAP